MKRTDNLQQAAVPLNNYQFDFGLPGMPKPSGSLKDQQKAQMKSTPQSSAGWSASPGGWGSSQSGSDQAFDFLGRSNGAGASNPNVGAQVRPQMGGNVSSTYDFLGKPAPMGGGGGGGYYGSKPQVGNVGGMNSFLSQTGAPAKGGVDLSGKSWGQTTASKLASAGIPGYKPSSKEDVFGDLLGGALGGKSSAPLKQQQTASSAGAYGMSNLQSAMPEVTKAQVQEKPAKPAPFSYTAMFKSPTPPAQKPAPKPQARGVDPFADISFSKPSNGPSTDPFDFGTKKQTAPPAPAPVSAARAPSSDPFGSSAGVDQFDSIFGTAPAAKTAQTHDGWGDAFGAAAETHSFADEGVTTELEGVGAAPPGVTGSAASQKGSTFYKEGQFPNAIKWFSWAVELLEKEKASKDSIIEVLTKRISCFKEIGEMKKAIADCTKACDLKPGCVELLMQRAHLYESCEKIKLGIADLREVLKIEPSHRLASQTVARLEKML
ncbi:hypothetical protein KC19_4G235500 [Ceratodon purpureus]|uniref:Uncharacterized protein n=1 Tax=Ceratodon purpureus TaxID=3225 RepID=A0A8T0IEC5_CERPU|nr:hypothetical protein KC19_4G235500 [Ceratodon purpureus]